MTKASLLMLYVSLFEAVGEYRISFQAELFLLQFF